MSFKNPNFRKIEKNLNNNISNEEETLVNDKIISLNEIMEPTITQNSYLEYIVSPLSANITDIPRNINFSLDELGKLNIKYENYFNNINKMM